MKEHIPCLDGIRGGLALWVFWGHIATVVGFRVPLLENLALAVDLFMLLSGFIMAWQWELSLQRPTQKPFGVQLSNFWLRRFFRISPLYYTLFFVSLFVMPHWAEAKSRLMTAFHPNEVVAATNPSLVTFTNISVHLSYIFGLIPKFVANNALPDWSLSLEMQFYLALPFLMLLCRPTRIWVLSLGSVVVCIITRHFVGTEPGDALVHLPHPSFLFLKIQIFAAGMALGWLAANRTQRAFPLRFWCAFLIPLALVPHPVAVAALGISALILSPIRKIRAAADILGTPPFKMAGDLSYCVYLVHLIPSYFLLDLAIRFQAYRTLPSYWRFFSAIVFLTPIVYLLAYIAHRLIERPGIELGKRLSAHAPRQESFRKPITGSVA